MVSVCRKLLCSDLVRYKDGCMAISDNETFRLVKTFVYYKSKVFILYLSTSLYCYRSQFINGVSVIIFDIKFLNYFVRIDKQYFTGSEN